MPTVDEVRNTIRTALELLPKPLGPIQLITAMKKYGGKTYDRTYLSDFLKDKKRSLDQDFREDLAEFLGIDVELLRIVKPRPKVESIGDGANTHYYISEHMKARDWDDKDLAGRMEGINEETVKKWRSSRTLRDWQAAGFALAFGFDDPAALTRPPAVSAKAKKPAARKRA